MHINEQAPTVMMTNGTFLFAGKKCAKRLVRWAISPYARVMSGQGSRSGDLAYTLNGRASLWMITEVALMRHGINVVLVITTKALQ